MNYMKNCFLLLVQILVKIKKIDQDKKMFLRYQEIQSNYWIL